MKNKCAHVSPEEELHLFKPNVIAGMKEAYELYKQGKLKFSPKKPYMKCLINWMQSSFKW